MELKQNEGEDTINLSKTAHWDNCTGNPISNFIMGKKTCQILLTVQDTIHIFYHYRSFPKNLVPNNFY